VILPTDIPTRDEIDRLLEHRSPASVSIYLPTDPASNGEPERIELKNLAAQASSELRDAGAAVSVIREFEEEIAHLYDDDDGQFWRYQARSLAAFAGRVADHVQADQVDDLPSDVASAAGNRRSRIVHRLAVFRARKDRRSESTSTPGRSIGPSGRF
jgi:hypothetical protein